LIFEAEFEMNNAKSAESTDRLKCTLRTIKRTIKSHFSTQPAEIISTYSSCRIDYNTKPLPTGPIYRIELCFTNIYEYTRLNLSNGSLLAGLKSCCSKHVLYYQKQIICDVGKDTFYKIFHSPYAGH